MLYTGSLFQANLKESNKFFMDIFQWQPRKMIQVTLENVICLGKGSIRLLPGNARNPSGNKTNAKL